MGGARKERAATEQKRRQLLDATEEIMLEEGYAAVSSRSVATAVGINASGVHYYFRTLDDLFCAVLERRAGRNVSRMAEALLSPKPLEAWWAMASDPRGTALMVELMAAANHRPVLHEAVSEIAHRVRAMQIERLETLLPEYGLDAKALPPVLVAAAIQGLAFGIVQEEEGGYDTRPDEARAAMERLVEQLEGRRKPRTPR